MANIPPPPRKASAQKAAPRKRSETVLNTATASEERLFAERPALSEYLSLMTGSVEGAQKVASESYIAIAALVRNHTGFAKMRQTLFVTARNFASESWNHSYKPGAETLELQPRVNMSTVLLTLLQNMAPAEREILLLRDRYGFSENASAEIMGTTQSTVLELMANAEAKLIEQGQSHSSFLDLLQAPTTLNPDSSVAPQTMALSEVIENVRRSRQSGRQFAEGRGRSILLFIVVTAATAAAMHLWYKR